MVLAVVAALAGFALMVTAGLVHRKAREQYMDELIGLTPMSLLDEDPEAEVGPVTHRAVELAAQMVEKVDRRRSLSQSLEKAKIPVRPAEFVVIVACGALGVAALVLVVTSSIFFAVAGALAAVGIASQVVKTRITRRRKAFEAQLPDALSLVASSLAAGHTFLRAIQMMCEEAGPPLAEEFSRVVAETRLGDSIVVALERMSERLDVRDLDMVVQAIRIQQTVGGRLADLLHTLADFIRARDEVRREVSVLTAEGRMSAYVLAALVPFLFGVIQVLNPDYAKPLFSGWGLAILGYCAGSILIGMAAILKMVRIDI